MDSKNIVIVANKSQYTESSYEWSDIVKIDSNTNLYIKEGVDKMRGLQADVVIISTPISETELSNVIKPMVSINNGKIIDIT